MIRLRRVYLLRHGETDWNVGRRLQGSRDTPLNPTGLRQAQVWRPYFDQLNLAGVYSSSLDRALQTAWLATGRPACIIPGFNERGFGEWEGQHWVDLERTITGFDMQWNDNAFSPAGGESRTNLYIRVHAALEQTLCEHRSGDDILIVAHGASGHAIMCALLDHPIEARGSLPTLTNASLTLLEIEAGKGTLVGQIASPPAPQN